MAEREQRQGVVPKGAGTQAVLFDFGGVLAEEGFREGLRAIATKQGLDPATFFKAAEEIIHADGYVTGKSKEAGYWRELKQRTGIRGEDRGLRREILSRFRLRPAMLRWVSQLQEQGYIVGILSDQTNWLEELDRQHPFFGRFDYLFNSYRMGMSKRNPDIFTFVCKVMGLRPHLVLFVDDNEANVRRAKDKGLKTILYTDQKTFEAEIRRYVKGV